MAHLVKSNAVMLEWLRSTVVYLRNEDVVRQLWELGKAFFNPVSVSWHYLSMAKNKLEDVRQPMRSLLSVCIPNGMTNKIIARN